MGIIINLPKWRFAGTHEPGSARMIACVSYSHPSTASLFWMMVVMIIVND